MRALTVQEVRQATGAVLTGGAATQTICGIANDSRRVKPGDLFVALRGEAADGHAYVSAALERGAAAVLVEKQAEPQAEWVGHPVLAVEDTVLALGDLAAYYRQVMNPRVIGITGSVGKTTTKDMIAAVLAEKYMTLKNEGNLNTEVGLPLTIFRLEPEHRMAVLEMGMRGAGQIRYLARIARPRIGVITNIGETHIELLGSVANIAAAKGELLEALPGDGIAILNGDDPWCRRIADKAPGKTIFYGAGETADVRATDVENRQAEGIAFTAVYGSQSLPVILPVPGMHNVGNALAAIAVGWQCGLAPEEIASGLARFHPSKMRLEIFRTGKITVINDAYNANPRSMEAALQVLSDLAAGARPVAILADMLELGDFAEAGHRRIGELSARSGVQLLLTVGPQAQWIAAAAREAGMPSAQIKEFAANDEALAILSELVQMGDVVLVKGSRGMKMEEIVGGLKNL